MYKKIIFYIAAVLLFATCLYLTRTPFLYGFCYSCFLLLQEYGLAPAAISILASLPFILFPLLVYLGNKHARTYMLVFTGIFLAVITGYITGLRTIDEETVFFLAAAANLLLITGLVGIRVHASGSN